MTRCLHCSRFSSLGETSNFPIQIFLRQLKTCLSSLVCPELQRVVQAGRKGLLFWLWTKDILLDMLASCFISHTSFMACIHYKCIASFILEMAGLQIVFEHEIKQKSGGLSCMLKYWIIPTAYFQPQGLKELVEILDRLMILIHPAPPPFLQISRTGSGNSW